MLNKKNEFKDINKDENNNRGNDHSKVDLSQRGT